MGESGPGSECCVRGRHGASKGTVFVLLRRRGHSCWGSGSADFSGGECWKAAAATLRDIDKLTLNFAVSSFPCLRVCQELHGAQNPLAFFHEDQLICLYVSKCVDVAAGPADFECVDLFRFSQAKVNAQIVLRNVAASAANFVDLLVWPGCAGRMGYANEACSDAASVGFGADDANLDPIVVEFGTAPQELRIAVDGVYDNVDVA